MRAAGAPLARTSRLLLLLLLKVSASPALGSALAPRKENCLGERCSPTLLSPSSLPSLWNSVFPDPLNKPPLLSWLAGAVSWLAGAVSCRSSLSGV